MCPSRQEGPRQANLLGATAVAVGDRTSAAAVRATGLPAVEVAALSVLATSLPGAPLGSLADALALTQPGATRLADRLVRRGLLRREPGPDARTSALHLTAAGATLAWTALAAREAACDGLLDALDPLDRARLAVLLGDLLEPLATSTTEAIRGCRLCDPDACGHHAGRCPVTAGLDARGR